MCSPGEGGAWALVLRPLHLRSQVVYQGVAFSSIPEQRCGRRAIGKEQGWTAELRAGSEMSPKVCVLTGWSPVGQGAKLGF